jgi:hypothetical protein
MKLDNAGRVTGQSISGSIWQHCSRAGTGKEARAQAESIDASGPQILIQISAAGNIGNLRQVTLTVEPRCRRREGFGGDSCLLYPLALRPHQPA